MSRAGDLCFGKEDSTVASLPLLCGRREERRWNFKSLAFLFPPSRNEYWLWLEAPASPPGGGGQIHFPSESYSFHATTNSFFYFTFCFARNERPGKLDYASDARVQLVQSAVVASFSPYIGLSCWDGKLQTGNSTHARRIRIFSPLYYALWAIPQIIPWSCLGDFNAPSYRSWFCKLIAAISQTSVWQLVFLDIFPRVSP